MIYILLMLVVGAAGFATGFHVGSKTPETPIKVFHGTWTEHYGKPVYYTTYEVYEKNHDYYIVCTGHNPKAHPMYKVATEYVQDLKNKKHID